MSGEFVAVKLGTVLSSIDWPVIDRSGRMFERLVPVHRVPRPAVSRKCTRS